MKIYQFNKLIRSKLPARMKKEGVKIVGRKLNKKEFILELENKLVEEAIEVKEAKDRDSLIKELADVMEVIESLTVICKISKKEIEKEQTLKRKVNGKFLPANFVDYIEIPADNHKVAEYLKNKNRPYKFI